MEQIITGGLMAVGLVLFVILMVILGTLFGVDTMGMTMWQLGATLGFISGFFKASHVKAGN